MTVEEGGFAGAVGTDQSAALPCGNLQIDAANGVGLPKTLAQRADFQCRNRHVCSRCLPACNARALARMKRGRSHNMPLSPITMAAPAASQTDAPAVAMAAS